VKFKLGIKGDFALEEEDDGSFPSKIFLLIRAEEKEVREALSL